MHQSFVKSLAAGAFARRGCRAARLSAAAADTPVTFQLNWMAGGANAGFAAAVAEGYYKEAGLDVTLVQGNGSGNTAQLVANGRAQLAYADAVAVSQLIAKGAPMKIVVDHLPVESERGDVAQEDRHQVGQGPRGQEGRRAVGLVADDDAAAAAQVQQPQGVRHQHDRHAGRVDGAGAAAGPGRCRPRLDRRLPDPGRVAGRAARRLPLRRLRRADGQHVDLREQQLSSRTTRTS